MMPDCIRGGYQDILGLIPQILTFKNPSLTDTMDRRTHTLMKMRGPKNLREISGFFSTSTLFLYLFWPKKSNPEVKIDQWLQIHVPRMSIFYHFCGFDGFAHALWGLRGFRGGKLIENCNYCQLWLSKVNDISISTVWRSHKHNCIKTISSVWFTTLL